MGSRRSWDKSCWPLIRRVVGWGCGHSSRGLRFRLVALLLTIGGCASTPHPPPRQRPPLEPVEVVGVRLSQAARYYLKFHSKRPHLGLVLDLRFTGVSGEALGEKRVSLGRASGRAALAVGDQRRVSLLTADQEASELSVSGRQRPVLGMHRKDIPFAQVRHVTLISARECYLRSYEWQYGMPGPEGIAYLPRPGERFTETRCDRVTHDPGVAEGVAFEVGAEPDEATLELEVTYRRDFEGGVVWEAALLGRGGRYHRECRLRVSEATVYETQRKRYRVVVRSTGAGAALAGISRARIASVVPGTVPPADGRYRAELRCGVRPARNSQQGRPLPRGTLMP